MYAQSTKEEQDKLRDQGVPPRGPAVPGQPKKQYRVDSRIARSRELKKGRDEQSPLEVVQARRRNVV